VARCHCEAGAVEEFAIGKIAGVAVVARGVKQFEDLGRVLSQVELQDPAVEGERPSPRWGRRFSPTIRIPEGNILLIIPLTRGLAV